MFLDKAGLPYRSCRFWVNLLFKHITVCLCLDIIPLCDEPLLKICAWWKKCTSQHYIAPFPHTRARLFWVSAVFLTSSCPTVFPTWSSCTLRLHPPQAVVLPHSVLLLCRSMVHPGPALAVTEMEQPAVSPSLHSLPDTSILGRLGHRVY